MNTQTHLLREENRVFVSGIFSFLFLVSVLLFQCMMEKKHRCKLCFRSFANGRALGGHMRSHMMKFYAAQKLSEQEEEEENHSFDDFQSAHSYSSTSSSSSSEDEQEEEESHEVKAVASGSVVLQDRESETESFKRNPICRRSKRVRKSRISDFVDGFFGKKLKLENECCSSMVAAAAAENEPLSSVSDTASDEHVAHCLMMLSRDNWKREEETELQFEIEDEKKFIDDDDDSEDSGVGKVIKTSNNKVRGKYRCEACNKLFRSYQALGGHRASHKKIKVAAPPQKPNANSGGGSAAVVEEKIHQCPFCPRIFSSGQALGGHKRTHLLGGGAITAGRGGTIAPPAKERSRSGETLSIDLNLPAPIDDDEASQIAVSALSDAEFVHSIKQW